MTTPSMRMSGICSTIPIFQVLPGSVGATIQQRRKSDIARGRLPVREAYAEAALGAAPRLSGTGALNRVSPAIIWAMEAASSPTP